MRPLFRLFLVVFVSILLTSAASAESAFQATTPNVQYLHWEDLPAGPLKTESEIHGSKLINNFNIVKEQDGKAILIRGGGFTPANIDWLAKTMGVRTFIDLRGKFSDDKTNQFIALSPGILAEYKHARQLDKLRNLSPTETNHYIYDLAEKTGLPLYYANESATDPKLLIYLDAAAPDHPVAMFCQWGVNRSGTAWGAYAKHHGWSLQRALDTFGVKDANGHIRNTRDITYGYNLRSK